MNRPGDAGDQPLTHRPQVAGVDLLADTNPTFGIDTEARCDTAEGFCQGD